MTKKQTGIAVAATASLLCSCSNISTFSLDNIQDSGDSSRGVTYQSTVYEAENANLWSVSKETSGNRTYAYMKSQGAVTFNVHSPSAKKVKLVINACGVGSDKTNYIDLNGSYYDTFVCKRDTWGACYNMEIPLKAGDNTIAISACWGWTYIDSIELIETVYIEEETQKTENNSNNNNGNEVKFEAEKANLTSVGTENNDGREYAFLKSEGAITFTINSATSKKSVLKIMAKGCGSDKTNYVSVNGASETFDCSESNWADCYNKEINLNKGTNTISITPSWGWTYVDYISLSDNDNSLSAENAGSSSSNTPSNNQNTNNSEYSVVSVPCNPNATNEAKNLMKYLASGYGKQVLSGQMDLTWYDGVDMAQRVQKDTGKLPAIMGYDFMNYLDGNEYWSGMKQTEEAIAWHNKGGIVTFCWHWKVTGNNGNRNFYTTNAAWDGTDYNIPYNKYSKTWDTSSNAYKTMINDMDRIAVELQKLQNAGVPVLWRPLHEASGGWFWWGKDCESYKALYTFMYDYFTKTKGLNNLIWVWNGQNKNWYPGDKYVDIIGVDIYASSKDYSSHYWDWKNAENYSDNPNAQRKMVALSENGVIPSPSNIQNDGAWWAYFMTWNDGSANNYAENCSDQNNFWTGEYHQTKMHRQEVYNSSLVITLDELKK